jgi:hypothetical protein
VHTLGKRASARIRGFESHPLRQRIQMAIENENRESREESIQERMDAILNSIPEEGPTPDTTRLLSELEVSLFPQDYIERLRSIGLNVENVHTGLSDKKVEIALAIKYPDFERQVFIRYRKGEPVLLRFTTGTWEKGEKVLYEEKLTGTLNEIVLRTRNIIEGLVSSNK